jgi:hypothetical protein
MFSSFCLGAVVGLATDWANFTPPSKDLPDPLGRSNTRNEGSAAGAFCNSSRAFVVDFRRPNPLVNLGM